MNSTRSPMRGIPPAVGDVIPGELARVRLGVNAPTVVVDGVARGPQAGQVVRGAADKAPHQAERRPDVLLDVHGPRIPGEGLDHAGEVDEGGIAVAEPGARRKGKLLIGHHRDQLLPARRLERFPRPSLAVGPGGILEAGGMREQHPERDVVHGAEAVVHLSELRNVPRDRVVQREQAAIAQLHDRDRGERLRDRSPVIDPARIRRRPALPIAEAVRMLREDPAAA